MTENLDTVAGVDYVGDSVELVFSLGDTRVCHNITIIDDGLCEEPFEFTESFQCELTSDDVPLDIIQPLARVDIDDLEEPECGKNGPSLSALAQLVLFLGGFQDQLKWAMS